MPTFQYQAINRSGSAIKGSIDADNPQVAQAILAEQGLFVDSISLAQPAAEIKVKASVKRSTNSSFRRNIESSLSVSLPPPCMRICR